MARHLMTAAAAAAAAAEPLRPEVSSSAPPRPGRRRSAGRWPSPARLVGTLVLAAAAAAAVAAAASSTAVAASVWGRRGDAAAGAVGLSGFVRPSLARGLAPRCMARAGCSHEGRQRPRSRARGHATALLEAPQRYGSQDWIENLKSLLVSRIAKRISGHLFFNTAWAAAVTAYYEYSPTFHVDQHVSPIPHQLMSSALGLLLVFRTNAAYDRFWEARKVWGSVTNVARNLARTGSIALDRKYHGRFAMLICAFAISLKAHLQRTVVSTELEQLLPHWECDQIRVEPCPPALIATKMSHLINEAVSHNAARSAEFYNLYLEQLVGQLVDCLGMAERILLTPVPASYSRHTSRFLSLYTLTLPFVLVHQLEMLTVPAVAAICWGLFSIEEIGHLIEEPFAASTKQLPLDRMTQTIARDVRRLLRVPHDEGMAITVDEDLLSAEDREFADSAPRLRPVAPWQPAPPTPLPVAAAAMEGEGGGGPHLAAEGGGGVMGSNSTLTAAAAAQHLRSTETLNI